MIDEKELLNLTADEKLAIIDLLQTNLYGSEYQVTEEQKIIISERMEKIEKGHVSFSSLEQFREQLKKRKG